MTLDERLAADGSLLTALAISCDRSGRAGSEFDWHLQLHVGQAQVNAGEMCHGGFLFALADTACAYALAERGATPATTDANISYLRAARLGDLVEALPRIVHSGRTQGVVEVRLERATDRVPLAVFRGTCANLGARQTAG